MKIFLDDIRFPVDCVSYMHKRIGALNPIYLEEWVIVRNYKEFVKEVSENIDTITHVSFDHDLADIHYNPATWTQSFSYKEETGYDCAKWMLGFYKHCKKPLPVMFVHSMNPVGTERIIKLFQNAVL